MIFRPVRRLFQILNGSISTVTNKNLTFWFGHEPQAKIERFLEDSSISRRYYYYNTNLIKTQEVLSKQISRKTEDKYAQALYAAAEKSNKLKHVEHDMQTLQSILERDVRLRRLFSDPITSRKVQKQDMEAILSRLSFCPQTNNFLTILAENGRLSLLESIIISFQSLVSSTDDVICEVTTAEPFDDALKRKIEELVSAVYKNKRPVKYVSVIDPKIIGGIIVKIDDYCIDMSIARRLRELKEVLVEKL